MFHITLFLFIFIFMVGFYQEMSFYLCPNSQGTEELYCNKIPSTLTISEVEKKHSVFKNTKSRSIFCINLIEHCIVMLCQWLIMDYLEMSRIKIIRQFVKNTLSYRIYPLGPNIRMSPGFAIVYSVNMEWIFVFQACIYLCFTWQM